MAIHPTTNNYGMTTWMTSIPSLYISSNTTSNVSTTNIEEDFQIIQIVVYALVAMFLVFVVLAMIICRYTFSQRGTYRTSEPIDISTEDVILLKNEPGFHDTLHEEEE